MAAPRVHAISLSSRLVFAFVFVAALLISGCHGDERVPDFDFERDSFIAHSFKMWVGAGSEECAYQKIRAGAQVNLGFEVLSGGDRDVSLFVVDSSNEILKKFNSVVDGSWEKIFDKEDVVAFCFENYESRFSEKLVFFFVSAFVNSEIERQRLEEDEKSKQVEEFDDLTQKTRETMERLGERFMNMTYHQTISRMHMLADYYVGESNNAWVMEWSLLQIVVIAVTAGVQVFFLRRMFGSAMETKTPTGNIRA